MLDGSLIPAYGRNAVVADLSAEQYPNATDVPEAVSQAKGRRVEAFTSLSDRLDRIADTPGNFRNVSSTNLL